MMLRVSASCALQAQNYDFENGGDGKTYFKL
jgi:hypothetical protein